MIDGKPQGRFESPPKRGPGTRYRLELSENNFKLESFAWAFTGKRDADTDEPKAELIGVRVLSGKFRTEGVQIVLHALLRVDQSNLGQPDDSRQVSEFIPITFIGGPSDEMTFKLYGSEVTLLRAPE